MASRELKKFSTSLPETVIEAIRTEAEAHGQTQQDFLIELLERHVVQQRQHAQEQFCQEIPRLIKSLPDGERQRLEALINDAGIDWDLLPAALEVCAGMNQTAMELALSRVLAKPRNEVRGLLAKP